MPIVILWQLPPAPVHSRGSRVVVCGAAACALCSSVKGKLNVVVYVVHIVVVWLKVCVGVILCWPVWKLVWGLS